MGKGTGAPPPSTETVDDARIWVTVADKSYDVTDYAAKHPGGSVIKYMLANTGADATEVYREFHMRSKKANLVLKGLPSKPAVKDTSVEGKKNNELLTKFAIWRKELEDEGFFETSLTHVAYRFTELWAIFALGIYLFSLNTTLSVLGGIFVHGIFGGRCGWFQHEGGHNSLTGNMWIDKRLQAWAIGFGLGSCGAMWNSMHQKHHATPQKVGHDMDLDTTPLAAFFKTAHEDNRPRPFSKAWARFQAYTFLPITSGVFIMGFWLLYLHPRECLRKGLWEQLVWMVMSHVARTWAIMNVTGWSLASSYGVFAACMWTAGVYLFGHFSLSHTHLGVVDRMDHPTWVHYSVDYTIDINPANPLINWVMGYLNCQVIHHLFPNMPQYKQPEVSRRFAIKCKEWGLKYQNFGYWEAVYATFKNLDDVGKHYEQNGLDKARKAKSKSDVGALGAIDKAAKALSKSKRE
jgi:fatty acid desaturase